MNSHRNDEFEDADPLPDLQLAERFLKWLAPGDQEFTFYTFDDDKIRNDRTLAKHLHGTFKEHAAELERLNCAGAAVCVVAHVTDGKDRRTENVTEYRGIHWADIERPYDPTLYWHEKPHAVLISSDQGFYPFWNFKANPPSANEWQATQRDLQDSYFADMADTAIKGPRLPGFYHRKKCAAKNGKPPRDGAPRMVRFEVQRPETSGRSDFAGKTAKHAEDMRDVRKRREKEHSSAREEMGGEKLKPNADEALELLTFIEADDYGTWINVGMALKSEFGDDGFKIWDEWSQSGSSYTENATRERWPGFGDKVKYSTLCWYAKDGGADLAAIARKHGKARDTGKEKGKARDLSGKLRGLDEISPALENRYLVKGLIDRGASSVLYGEPNTGKTFFALDLALYVSAGSEWHGRMVPDGARHAGAVVYVAAEGGRGIDNRVAAFKKRYPDIAARANGRFFLLTEMLDIGTGAGANEIINAIKVRIGVGEKIALIVIDTLARTMGGGDENHARDMGVYVHGIDEIREATGAHVMIVHHSGKDAARGARGSNSLRGAVDTELGLDRHKDDKEIIVLKNSKQRDQRLGRNFGYKLEDVNLGFDEDNEQVQSAVIVPVEMADIPAKVQLKGQPAIAYAQLVTMSAPDRGPVKLDDWKAACRVAGICKEGASRQAFDKAMRVATEKLTGKRLIEICNPYVNLIEQDDNDVI